jgi:tetratricopeptide (TPR) repeat protein
MHSILRSLALLPAFGALPAAAAPTDHAGEYRACLKLVAQAPWEAYESARAWQPLGGGDAARHCAALALIELQQYDPAAHELEEIAQSQAERGEVPPAALLGQAANAWFLAGRLDRAEQTIISALERAPDDPALLVDWGRILGEAGRYSEALAALDQALAIDGADAGAHAFRASALRHLDRPAEAMAAADRALMLQPDNAAALLERGLLRRLAGDAAGARADWLKLAMAHEGTPAADAARAYLEEMDLKTK